MNREPCRHGIVGHEDCETMEIERLEKELAEQRDQVDRWARLAVELETQRDQAADACAGDLANMRARVEAVTAELATAYEAKRLALDEAAGSHRAADLAEAEVKRVKDERDVWRGAHAIGQNTMASMVAERDRLRAALEIAAKDTSWEYVHKVAREALGGKYSEASDRGEAKESAEKYSEKYSCPALPIDHEAEAKMAASRKFTAECSEHGRKLQPRGVIGSPTLPVEAEGVRVYSVEETAIKAAIARAKAETWEEAAWVAEASADDCNCNVTPCEHDEHPVKTACRIAAALRARGGGK